MRLLKTQDLHAVLTACVIFGSAGCGSEAPAEDGGKATPKTPPTWSTETLVANGGGQRDHDRAKRRHAGRLRCE